MIAVVPSRSGPKSWSTLTPISACPSSVSSIEVTIPAGVPPMRTRSPLTS
jgi:hypothetical protein